MPKKQLYHINTIQRLSDPQNLLSARYQTHDLAIEAAKLVLLKNVRRLQWPTYQNSRSDQLAIRDKLHKVVPVPLPVRQPGEKIEVKTLVDQPFVSCSQDKWRVELFVPVQYRIVQTKETILTIEQDGQQYSRTEREEIEIRPWTNVPEWPDRLTLTIEPADLWIVETQEELDEAE